MKRLSVIGMIVSISAITINADYRNWYGAYSIFHYPSNLAIHNSPFFDLLLPYAGLELGNTFISLDVYNHYAMLDSFTSQNKVGLLRKFGEPFRLQADVSTIPFGVSIGNFGIAIRGVGGLYGTISNDILDLVLNGNELGRVYDLSDTRVSALGFVQLSLARAIRIMNVTAGLSVGYLYGFFHGEIEDHTGRFVSDSSYLEAGASIKYRYSTGGDGLTTSLSVGREIGENTTVSLGLENLFSRMRWTKDATQGVARVHIHRFNLLDLTDALFLDTMIFDTTYEYKESYDTKLPLILRVGVRQEFERFPLTLFLGYNQGFSNTAISSMRPRFSLLTQFNHISFLPLRLGLRTGGTAGIEYNIGMGLSLWLFYLDIDYATHGGWFAGSKGHGFKLALGLRSRVRPEPEEAIAEDIAPEGEKILITILDEVTQRPLGNIEFSIKDAKGKIDTFRTDSEGRFSQVFVEGVYELIVEPKNYEPHSSMLNLILGTVSIHEIKLTPLTGGMRGSIIDTETKEALTAIVSIYDTLGNLIKEVESDSRGAYEVWLTEGSYIVKVTAEGYIPEESTIFIKAGRRYIKDYILKRE